jgi:hypothetical protein
MWMPNINRVYNQWTLFAVTFIFVLAVELFNRIGNLFGQ